MDQRLTEEGAHLVESFGASTAALLKQMIAVIRRRKLLLLAGFLLVYALGALYFFSRDSLYEARASVLVHPMGDALSGRNDERPNFMPTHIRLVTSTSVLSRALEKLAANESEVCARPSADELADNLKASSQKDTEILEISYRTKDRTAAAPVVDAVVGSYLDFVNETHRSTSKDILQILTQQRDALEKQLGEKESRLLEMQQSQGVLALADEKASVEMSRLMAVNEALTHARMRRLELEGRLQAVRTAIIREESMLPYLMRHLDRLGPDLVSQVLDLKPYSETYQFHQETMQRDLARDQLELQRLRVNYGPRHPKVLMLEERIRLFNQSLQQERSNPAQKKKSERELQSLVVQLLESDIKEAKKVEEDLRQQCEVEKAVAVEVNARRAPFVALEMDLKRLRNFYDTLNLRIRQVNLGGDAGVVTTQVIEAPQEPKIPVSPNLKKVALACTILGLFFGLGLCYLFEWWDTSYRGPEDISQHLGLPVFGHIPKMEQQSDAHPVEMVMEYAARSMEAEAFRTIRTTLMLRDVPPKKFTITSPASGDGKTLIATNLAISYAKSGLRTLLVDGDMRRPRLREIFQLARSLGLSQLLQKTDLNQEDILAAIHGTSIANLFVLPSGPNPPNPTELLTGGQFAQILNWAEARYDVILCDAPPILAVSDCALMGRLLDGALLTVRADKGDRLMAARARDALQAMNCNVLGVIVNNLQATDTYGYSYYRKYAYYKGYHEKKDEGARPSPEQIKTPSQESDKKPGPDKKAA